MSELTDKMDKAMESLKQSFATVRTGRASPDILSRVRVECYGSILPLKQVASIHVQDTSTLVVTPFDRSTINDVEKGITKADLGLNPQSDGHTLRLPIPTLTEERRKELDKVVKKMAEDARIALGLGPQEAAGWPLEPNNRV
ncbi:MAG: ribosome recycling factor [Candidatus Margulisiibacteriota bacterium]